MSVVVLAMSGGVDSSVAAHLLLEQGHEVIGVFMRHGEQSPAVCAATPAEAPATDEANTGTAKKTAGPSLPVVSRLDHKQGCCTAADAEDARRVSDRLDIPFYALDLNAEFGQIMDYFVDEYIHGRTPNPCVQCNNWIKFGKLFDYADSVGADYVATGHYAQLNAKDNQTALLRGVDGGKDQSYVLFGIERPLLSRMLLPVGGFQKPRIRELAGQIGLNVAEKKDSQEICFVTSSRYDEFIRRRDAGGVAGQMVTTDGTVVGTHKGIEGFTVGQRKGLGVALGERMFVVRIEPDTNRVVLGDRDSMLRPELTAGKTNWLVDLPTEEPIACHAQIRYNAPAVPATMTLLPSDRLAVSFEQPQFGVAPGQAVVCYSAEDNTRVLGGGWIE